MKKKFYVSLNSHTFSGLTFGSQQPVSGEPNYFFGLKDFGHEQEDFMFCNQDSRIAQTQSNDVKAGIYEISDFHTFWSISQP